ncbi:hypothetical protein E3_1790 [Rhodococcus phage E3]|uniref:replication initiation protein n=1 Tax=Rhodococcus phage E3 TaxID=1007869 RepID=UPI0002C6D4AD|nr:replication initiation protein [Rhodococcus phage E3]AEQ21097.1 hypothetical protein E3_1790 [Rhodococcus phage E3]
MKITLPTGVVIESDRVIHIDGVEIRESAPAAPAAPEVRRPAIELSMQGAQTLQYVRDSEGPVSTTDVRRSLAIGSETARCRLKKLVLQGLIIQVSPGRYVAAKTR